MSKYIIHSCNDRQWYVDQYLVPSMLKQGIAKDDILVFQDKECKGALTHFLEYIEEIKDLPDGAWHLQDDVIICKDFKKRTEELNKENCIVCGFCDSYDLDEAIANGLVENKKLNMIFGKTIPKYEWYSLQCLWLPSYIIRDFIHWYYAVALRDGEMIRRYIQENRHEDTLIRMFIRGYYPDSVVINVKPNLVDHIDYLLGGSVVNGQRGTRNVRSLCFEDIDLVQELEEKIRDSRKEAD